MGMAHAWYLAIGDSLFYTNREALTSLSSARPAENNANILRNFWKIENRGQLLFTLNWLKYEGHSQELIRKHRFKTLSKEQTLLIEQYPHLLTHQGLVAWDYGRYSSLVRWAHTAGYVDALEAWELLEEIRPRLQSLYASWKEYITNYFYGRAFYDHNDPKQNIANSRTADFLLNNPFSRWHAIDWHTQDTSIPNDVPPEEYNPMHLAFDFTDPERLQKICDYFRSWCQADREYTTLHITCGDFIQKQNDEEGATPYYQHAAKLGDHFAQAEMGRRLEFGIGIEQNINLACDYFDASAQQGNNYARQHLAKILMRSSNTNDQNRGVALITQAADENDADALFWVGDQYYQGNPLFGKDLEKAVELILLADKLGSVDAANHLGTMYKFGEGVKVDINLAVHYFIKAAEMGDYYGHYNLGLLYYEGNAVIQDQSKAAYHFTEATKHHFPDAYGYLALLYRDGLGVARSQEKYVELLDAAAELGSNIALREICLRGEESINGNGVEKNVEQGLTWLKWADSFNYGPAAFSLGQSYEFVPDLKFDLQMAYRYYLRAAKNGDDRASERLDSLRNRGIILEEDI